MFCFRNESPSFPLFVTPVILSTFLTLGPSYFISLFFLIDTSFSSLCVTQVLMSSSFSVLMTHIVLVLWGPVTTDFDSELIILLSIPCEDGWSLVRFLQYIVVVLLVMTLSLLLHLCKRLCIVFPF